MKERAGEGKGREGRNVEGRKDAWVWTWREKGPRNQESGHRVEQSESGLYLSPIP